MLTVADIGLAKGDDQAMLVKPTRAQAAWQDMELIAFAHFGMNTFTDREWGEGSEDPRLFNPTQFDASRWIHALKAAGAKMLVLTAKHHDGFCLWASKWTEHSVKNSAWRHGTGDVVREVAEACRKGGIKFGVYLSPWDRHERTYGSQSYNEFFLNQLRELLTSYGPITEVWFDGANGEGLNGRKQEYDWAAYYGLIRRLQPEALIAICGPDIRWVGNESGLARENESSVQPTDGAAREGAAFRWYPAECDVSIRPGWFYHPSEDAQVKTLDELLDIYYKSIGRNSVLLLNVPPDRRGLIHENDASRLAEFGAEIKRRFGRSLKQTQGSGHVVELPLGAPRVIDHIVAMEDLRQGERVREYVIEGLVGRRWKELSKGNVIGHKRIVRFEPTELCAVRLRCLDATAEPIIRRLAVYNSLGTPYAAAKAP
jgi:alpha-L-fucosidase